MYDCSIVQIGAYYNFDSSTAFNISVFISFSFFFIIDSYAIYSLKNMRKKIQY